LPSNRARALERLEALKGTFGRRAAREKAELLRRLREDDLPDAGRVERLHDALLFVRAYPDDRRVLREVEAALAGFAERADLDRHRPELADTGIAGTRTHFRFYWHTARWIARRWGRHLFVDWPEPGRWKALLDRRLILLMPYGESLALEEGGLSTRDWVMRLKGPGETDGEFLVRRFEALRADPLPREGLYEEMDVPLYLDPGPDTPCSTRARYEGAEPIVFQTRSPARSRRTFGSDRNRPLIVTRVSRSAGEKLVSLARELMVVRLRDLDAFVHADPGDVTLLDCGGGLQFACLGTRPERRQMLDAAYAFLMIRNGIVIGYVLSAALFGSAEVAFNLSPAFRGAETTYLYARTLGVVRRLFAADTFVVDPYQMGYGNPEGLKSGAWWFYYKLGFRPRDPYVLRLAEAEERKVAERRGYRTSLARLDELASVDMYLHLGRPRDDVLGLFSRGNVGLWIVHTLARRFGSDRERGVEVCAREAARLLGLRSLSALSAGERLAWDRWAPLVLALPGVARWSQGAKSRLARVVRAKGGRRESDFVQLFDAHAELRAAVLALSREPPPAD
jgi:hypothetical protein